MEKLIELLNEYNIELHWVDRTYKDGFYLWYEQEYMRDFRVAYLISKSFWFIKRLIKKDKINIDKIPEIWEIYSDCNELIRYCYIVLEDDIYPKDCCLLMLLAISENPIEDLISYLK